jgi:hypothetical protein
MARALAAWKNPMSHVSATNRKLEEPVERLILLKPAARYDFVAWDRQVCVDMLLCERRQLQITDSSEKCQKAVVLAFIGGS